MAEPSCSISSPSDSWKVPVNAPSIPISVVENTTKLTPYLTIHPAVEYSLTVDAKRSSVSSSRVLSITSAVKIGDVLLVTLAGVCAGAKPPVSSTVRIEFVAEAPFPLKLGTLIEAPQGTTTLAFDDAFLPYQPFATISFSVAGAPHATYPPGNVAGPSDRYGVVACIGGACNTPENGGTGRGPSVATYFRLDASQICVNGRATGKVTRAITASAHIPAAPSDPESAVGNITIDCSKASERELSGGPGASSGCECNTRRSSAPGASGLAFLLGLWWLRRQRNHGRV